MVCWNVSTKLFGHFKMKLNKTTAKAIVGNTANPDIPWVERWLESWCRENSLPLQIIGNEFMSKLGNLLETQDALKMLARIRAEYKQQHPFETLKEEDFDFLSK